MGSRKLQHWLDKFTLIKIQFVARDWIEQIKDREGFWYLSGQET